MSSRPRTHYRCVGVGAGPANLSLASLLHDDPEVPNLFLEKKSTFTWHDGQQLPDTTLQVSLFKDLVSLADPTNKFSFLSYLHRRGRIYHFLNAQFDAVPRQEFRDYLAWASELNENVVFGEKVVAVEFDRTFQVHTESRTITADNLSIGVGRSPKIPPVAAGLPADQHYHICDFVAKARDLGGKRVCVVGGGQSGAEAFLDLIRRPDADRPRRVSWVTRRANYFPIDDSPFTNDFYTPSHSDYFANLAPAVRDAYNRRHVLTSDGISEATLRAIYQQVYVRRFLEGHRDLVALYPDREVVGVTRGSAGSWALQVAGNNGSGHAGQVDTDVVVWATGFEPATMDFLAPLAHRLERAGDELKIDHDFAVRWDGPPDRALFLHNGAERQRGLADRNLSLLAWRSQRIVDRLRGIRSDEPLPSFIEWSAKPGAAETGKVVLG